MKLYLLLYLLTREVAGVIQSVAWKEVFVSQTLVSFTVTLPVSAIKSGNICDATDKCVLVCAVEGGYGLSENKFESEYYEKEDVKYKCWTKMKMKYPPLKLDQDGLYYHADFTRSYKLNGEHCIFACRRITGYRLAIARKDDQFSAMYKEYAEPYGSSNKKYFLYIGLVKHQKNGEQIYKWMDGTDFNLAFSPRADNPDSKHFFIQRGDLNDWSDDGNCLCQGNPSVLDW